MKKRVRLKLEKRTAILLISLTFLAYLMKSLSGKYDGLIVWGNVLVAIVNLGLLFGTTIYTIVKILTTIFAFVCLGLMIIFNVDQNCADTLLNCISIVAISFTFWDIQKSYISSQENNETN